MRGRVTSTKEGVEEVWTNGYIAEVVKQAGASERAESGRGNCRNICVVLLLMQVVVQVVVFSRVLLLCGFSHVVFLANFPIAYIGISLSPCFQQL